MKKQQKIFIKTTLTFFVIFTCFQLANAGDLQIIDVFSNTSYDFKQVYKEINSTQVNLYGETQVITYVPENENAVTLKKITKQLLQITNNEWNNEGAFLLLYKEAKNKIAVYLELINSRNDRNNYGDNDEENRTIPRLKEIECKPISICNNLIWYRIEYQFEISSRNRSDQHEVKVAHYFTASINSGEVKQIKNSLNQFSIETVTKNLAPYFTHDYLIKTEKLTVPEIVESESGDYEENEYDERIHRPMQSMLGKDSAQTCRDLCEHLDFNEADFYISGWGLVIEFPSFSNSSKVYGGDAFSIFIPYSQLDFLLPYLPAFYFPKVGKKITTSINGFSEKRFFENIGKINSFPTIENVVEQQKNTKKIKTIFINSYQLFKEDKSNYRGEFTIKLDSTEKIIERIYENERKEIASHEEYFYDKTNRLTSTKRYTNSSDAETHYYIYDKKNNLTTHYSYEENSTNKECFFYNNDYVYRINIGNLIVNCSEGITSYHINGNEITFGGVSYLMDKNNYPIGVRKTKYSYQQFHVGHDEKGRIIESHFENDRRNYYFTFDKEDRLTRCQNFELQNPSVILDYFYNEKESLPFKYLKHTIQNNILEKEEYQYDYFN